MSNRKRGEKEGGRWREENSLERQSSNSNRRDVKWLYRRSGGNKGGGRVERRSIDVPKGRSEESRGIKRAGSGALMRHEVAELNLCQENNSSP